MKYFLKPYECSYHLSLLLLNLCKYQKIRGVSKKVIIFPTFFHYYSFSHELIKRFMKVVGNSLVIMHPNIHSRPQLAIKGCFGCTEVHLFQFQRVGRGNCD